VRSTDDSIDAAKRRLLEVLRDCEWHSFKRFAFTGWMPYTSAEAAAQALRQDRHVIEERRDRERFGLRLVRRRATIRP
jgi:hypothetical protein